MKWTVLLSVAVVISSYIGQSGGSSCMLTAIVSTNNNLRERLKLQLQCETVACTSPEFRCNNIYQDLAIRKPCSGQNCTKVYSLCVSPHDTCKSVDELKFKTVAMSSTMAHPTPTTVEECTKVTVYETETIDRLPEDTTVPKTTTVTVNTSPNCQSNSFAGNETTTLKFSPIATTTTSPAPCLCTRSVQEYETQSCQNGSKSDSTRQLSLGLGALVGILVVALVIVTTGWIWTCWISFLVNLKPDTTAGLRKANETVTTQNNNNKLGLQDIENNYQLLGKEEHNTNERAAGMDDDYADPDEENGWSQEENVYHVLEGPTAEENATNIEGEENTGDASVYEVPIKSK